MKLAQIALEALALAALVTVVATCLPGCGGGGDAVEPAAQKCSATLQKPGCPDLVPTNLPDTVESFPVK